MKKKKRNTISNDNFRYKYNLISLMICILFVAQIFFFFFHFVGKFFLKLLALKLNACVSWNFSISEHTERIVLLTSDQSESIDMIEDNIQHENFEITTQEAIISQNLAKLSHFGSMRMLHSLPTGQ